MRSRYRGSQEGIWNYGTQQKAFVESFACRGGVANYLKAVRMSL